METITIDGQKYEIVSGAAKVGDIVLFEGKIYTLRYRSEHTRNLWYPEEMGKAIARFDFKILKKIEE